MTSVLVACVCAGLAVLVWPDRPGQHPLSPESDSRTPGSPPVVEASSVEDLANAVVLLALALRGGASVVEALDVVIARTSGQVQADLRTVAAGHRWGVPSETVWADLSPLWRPVALAWDAAQRAGVPPSALLLTAASRIREAELAALEARVQRAAVWLVLPLGLLFLPGFVATTVLPIVLRLLTRIE